MPHVCDTSTACKPLADRLITCCVVCMLWVSKFRWCMNVHILIQHLRGQTCQQYVEREYRAVLHLQRQHPGLARRPQPQPLPAAGDVGGPPWCEACSPPYLQRPLACGSHRRQWHGICSSATASPAPAEACSRIGPCELTAIACCRGSAARSEDGDLAPGQLPRSMSLGSDAGFNADSKYEYRPQPLARDAGLEVRVSHGAGLGHSCTSAAGG